MKVLIAAGGTSWESRVEHRFENAVWYLLIDDRTDQKEVYQNLPPHDHNSILILASHEHVSAVVAGWVNSATARLMQSLNLRLCIAQNIRVRDVMKKLRQEGLPNADLTTFRQGLVVPGVMRRGNPVLLKKGPKFAGGAVSPTSTPRGHHHLQQYGGRGH